MNSVRYFVAVFVLVSLPPGFLLWFAIHPLARFWRKLGFGWTYTILALPVVAVMALPTLAVIWAFSPTSSRASLSLSPR